MISSEKVVNLTNHWNRNKHSVAHLILYVQNVMMQSVSKNTPCRNTICEAGTLLDADFRIYTCQLHMTWTQGFADIDETNKQGTKNTSACTSYTVPARRRPIL